MLERILVIDDEIDFAAFLRAGCEALGHTVEVCHSAAAARGRIASFDPDVLILDVVMPDEDGIELLQWLSCHGLRARVILVSGYNPHYLDLAGKLGSARGTAIAAMLMKPVTLAALRAALTAAAADRPLVPALADARPHPTDQTRRP